METKNITDDELFNEVDKIIGINDAFERVKQTFISFFEEKGIPIDKEQYKELEQEMEYYMYNYKKKMEIEKFRKFLDMTDTQMMKEIKKTFDGAVDAHCQLMYETLETTYNEDTI